MNPIHGKPEKSELVSSSIGSLSETLGKLATSSGIFPVGVRPTLDVVHDADKILSKFSVDQ